MSLITRFRGEVKDGKTLSAIYWTLRLAARMGIGADHIFTNMKGCYDHNPRSRTYGKRWATTVDIEDIIIDLSIEDFSEARIMHGVLLLDEAQTLFRTDFMRGNIGSVIINVVNQCGKRGLPLIYTTHLGRMVAPTVRDLTMMDILCSRDPKYPDSILWDVTNTRAMRRAIDKGDPNPPTTPFVLHHIKKYYRLYETDEVINPLSIATSVAGSKGMKKIHKDLAEKAAERGVKIFGADQVLGKDTPLAAALHSEVEMQRLRDSERDRMLSEHAQEPPKPKSYKDRLRRKD